MDNYKEETQRLNEKLKEQEEQLVAAKSTIYSLREIVEDVGKQIGEEEKMKHLLDGFDWFKKGYGKLESS